MSGNTNEMELMVEEAVARGAPDRGISPDRVVRVCRVIEYQGEGVRVAGVLRRSLPEGVFWASPPRPGAPGLSIRITQMAPEDLGAVSEFGPPGWEPREPFLLPHDEDILHKLAQEGLQALEARGEVSTDTEDAWAALAQLRRRIRFRQQGGDAAQGLTTARKPGEADE